MDRRTFLKTAVTVAVAGAFPLPAQEEGGFISLDVVKRARDVLARKADSYAFAIHPSAWNDISRDLTAKERWRLAYREERIGLRDYLRPLFVQGELGRVESILFISHQ